MTAERTISTGRKTLFSVLLVVVILLLLEGVVRLRAWILYGSTEANVSEDMLVPDPMTGLSVPRAGYRVESERLSMSINSLGFRGDEIAVSKPPQTIRIATVGASTTFCGEVSSNQATWPARLQTLLQEAHSDVRIEVINAGIPGYVVEESLKNLEARVLPLAPDLVIYYEANNDLARDTRALALEQGLATRPSPRWQALRRRSLLFDLGQKNMQILLARNAETAKLGALPHDLPQRYIGVLDRMRALLAARDIAFMTSTFFVKYRRDQTPEVQVENASIAFYYMPWLTIDGLLDGFDLYNDALVAFANDHRVPVIDDRSSIPGDSQHFADWAHFTDAGAERMAQRFARFIGERGILVEALERARGN